MSQKQDETVDNFFGMGKTFKEQFKKALLEKRKDWRTKRKLKWN